MAIIARGGVPGVIRVMRGVFETVPEIVVFTAVNEIQLSLVLHIIYQVFFCFPLHRLLVASKIELFFVLHILYQIFCTITSGVSVDVSYFPLFRSTLSHFLSYFLFHL